MMSCSLKIPLEHLISFPYVDLKGYFQGCVAVAGHSKHQATVSIHAMSPSL